MAEDPNDRDGDPLDAHLRTAETLYDRAPLRPVPGQFHTYTLTDGVIQNRGSELWEVTGADTTARQQLVDTFRNMQRDTGLPDGLVADIADGHITGLLTAERIPDDPEGDETAFAQRIEAGNAEIREQLAVTYGRQGGEEILERTRRFVRAHPRLAALMRDHGLGSRPDLVLGIASHVFSKGWR